jgi:hypothetical protein
VNIIIENGPKEQPEYPWLFMCRRKTHLVPCCKEAVRPSWASRKQKREPNGSLTRYLYYIIILYY